MTDSRFSLFLNTMLRRSIQSVSRRRAFSTQTPLGAPALTKFVDYDWKDALRVEESLLTEEEQAVMYASKASLHSSISLLSTVWIGKLLGIIAKASWNRE